MADGVIFKERNFRKLVHFWKLYVYNNSFNCQGTKTKPKITKMIKNIVINNILCTVLFKVTASQKKVLSVIDKLANRMDF